MGPLERTGQHLNSVTPRITAAMCAYGRTLAEPRLSPDGSKVAFLANVLGRGQIVVVPVTGGAEVVVTSDPPPAPAAAYGGGTFDWLADGSGIVYVAKDGCLYIVGAGTSVPRKVVDAPAAAPAVSPDGRRVAYVVDAQHVGVASLDEGGPWPVRLPSTADFCFDPTWSPDGTHVAWQEWDVPAMPWDASRVVVAAADSSERVVVAGGDGVQAQQPRFSPVGAGIAYLSDEGGWLNLHVDGRPAVKEPHEHGEPTWGQGQRSFAWSPDGAAIAFNRNERGFGRLCVTDLASGETRDLGRGVHGGLSWAGGRIVALRSGARTPTSIVAVDPADGARTLLARGPVAGFEAAGLVEPEAVEWPGEDGVAVHGRLYRPELPLLDPPPLLVWTHGGPTSQWPVTFIPRVAFWVDRGWAVLLPDHRGSTGWGRDYAQAMRGRWGELDVADVAAGMRAAAERGWCDPRRMVPIGGSAGGFTTLLLLALHPELCAAGVELFGVADLFDLAESTHRFEAHYLDSIVGSLPEHAARYSDRSPVHLADRIRSPLLILQGDADKVVPPAQSKAIAEAVRAGGGTVELHLYEGEGHGWLRPETLVDELTRIEAFLTRHVLRR